METVDSTNNYAANLIKLSHPPEGTVITAQHQSIGKGQRNANWESQEGQNLMCSIILYPKFITATHQFALSQTIALAVFDVLQHQCNSDVFIKWPNDIIVTDKKISGILIEATWTDKKMSSAIVGIGINLNQLTFQSPHATSIKKITGKTLDVASCLLVLLEAIEKYYIKLQSGNYAELDRLYFKRLYKAGEISTYIYQHEEIKATIIGVDQFGRLKLQKNSGELLVCSLKEISMIL